MKYKPLIAADKSSTDSLSLKSGKLVGILRAVHEKGADFRMTARGQSMYPTILDGDIITISPFRDLPPYPGEVVAFTRPGTEKLVVHRIIKQVAGEYLIKGDNTFEPDGTIPEGCLLGAVIRVERKNKPKFWPNRFNHKYLARLYFTLVPTLCMRLEPCKTGLLSLGARVVHSRTYRTIMKSLRRRFLDRIDINVEPLPSTAGKQKTGTGRDNASVQATHSRIRITAQVKQKQIGFMELFESSAECPFMGWWIGDYGVDLPYKGCGIEEHMLSKAEEVLTARGVTSIMINLWEQSECIGSWCQDSGLQCLPVGYCGKIDRNKRIVMKKLIVKTTDKLGYL